MTTLTINNLSHTYASPGVSVLKNISWTVQPNSFNLLSGPSGAGKSTLMRLMAGLEKPQTGTILINQYPVHTVVPFDRAQRIALLFQNPTRQFTMQTAQEELTFALENIKTPQSQIQSRIQTVLAELNLINLADRPLLQLSGGEQQKIALAIILAMDTDIILLDEPFANVDPSSRLALLKLLKQIQVQHAKTIIITDHDLNNYQSIIDHHYQITATGELKLGNQQQLSQNPPVIFLDHSDLTMGPLSWHNLKLIQQDQLLLKSNNFNIPAASIGLLSGANGSGKSTLLKTLSRQIPLSGQLTWKTQKTPKHWSKLVGYGFQTASNQFIELTPRAEFAVSSKVSQQSDYWTPQLIAESVSRLELGHTLEQSVYQLSGGQQKKVQTLALLILGLPVLLLDEPLAGIDLKSIHVLMEIMSTYVKATQTSIFMISHQRHGLEPFIDYERMIVDQNFINPSHVEEHRNVTPF